MPEDDPTDELTGGLKDMAKFQPASVRAREEEILLWESGEELEMTSDQIRMYVRGDTNSGKTHTVFSMLEFFVEDMASNDEHIRDILGHWPPEAIDQVLNHPEGLAARRSVLRQAYKVIYLDFDYRGADELFASQTCNRELFDCFNYLGVRNWEQGVIAIKEGLKMLDEHEAAGWGRRGCWFVIDNMEEAWQEVQSDYVKSSTGLTHTEMSNQIRAKIPGINKAARKAQGEERGRNMDWVYIKSVHKEWFSPILRSGFNMMLMAPTKVRKEEVALVGGGKEEQEVPQFGGEKNLKFFVNWGIAKFKTPDGLNRYAQFDKCRFTGLQPRMISNPTFANIYREMQRLIQEHLAGQQAKFASRDYMNIEDLNIDISAFASLQTPKKRRRVRMDVPDIPMPTSPPPISHEAGLGLADIPLPQVQTADVPLPVTPQTEADIPLPNDTVNDEIPMPSFAEKAEIPDPTIPVPVEEVIPEPDQMSVYEKAESIEDAEQKKEIFEVIEREDIAKRVRDILSSVESIEGDALVQQFEEDEELVMDVVNDLIHLEIIQAEGVNLFMEQPDVPTPDDVPPPPGIVPPEPFVGPHFVSGLDQGLGKYHTADCGLLRKMAEVIQVEDAGDRDPCKRCHKTNGKVETPPAPVKTEQKVEEIPLPAAPQEDDF